MQNIFIQRMVGGYGDILCATVAARAAREKYKDANIVFAVWENAFPLVHDQLPGVMVVSPEQIVYGQALENYKPNNAGLPGGDWDFNVSLEGPEIRYAKRVLYDIRESRTVTWCKSVDHIPSDLRPRWKPMQKERRQFVGEWLRGCNLAPFDYVVVQWSSAIPEKHWKNVDSLIKILRDSGIKVVILHYKLVPDFNVPELRDAFGAITQVARPVWEGIALPLRIMGLLIENAALVVAPDSAMVHMAAATDTPCIGIFGPTNPEIILKHYPLVSWFWHKDVAGQQCEHTFPCWASLHRNYWCVHRENRSSWCLDQIEAEPVAAKVHEQLAHYKEYNREKLLRLSYDKEDIAPSVPELRSISGSKRQLVVGVLPGIGDSLWAMTKVQAIAKAEGAERIVIMAKRAIPLRSIEFLSSFSFVTRALYSDFPIHPPNVEPVNGDGTYHYVHTMRDYYGMDWILVPNTPLENGRRLESWLPEYEINFEICVRDLKFDDRYAREASVIAADSRNRYVVFFCGSLASNTRDGHNRNGLWRPEDWLALGDLLNSRFGLSVVIVGASYDLDYLDLLKRAAGHRLPEYYQDVVSKTHIMTTYEICKKSAGVVSFQSGIGIASVYLGIPTVLWWRPRGDSISPSLHISFDEAMAQAWAPPWSLEGQYLPQIYTRCTPESIVTQMESSGWFSDSPPHYWKKQNSHPLRQKQCETAVSESP